MMLRKTISIIFILSVFCANVFANTAIITTQGDNKYKSIRLTPEIYNNANDNLSDLLLKDSSGEDVPYFIWGGLTINFEKTAESFPMSLINSYTKDNAFYFDYKLTNVQNSDIIATSIKFTTHNTGFAKNVDVYGSYDNKNWDYIKKDTLYNIDDKQKLEILFDKELKFTYYRIKLGNNLEKISFFDVQLVCNTDTKSEMYFSEMLTPEFSVETKDKETYITIEGTKNLRPVFVKIGTDSMFKRMVTTPFGVSAELYNLNFGDTNYSNTRLLFGRNIALDEKLVLTIHNGDDKPINVDNIKIMYYADDLIFKDNNSENYTLNFGKNESKTAPVYDIARYKDEILKENIDRAEITEFDIKQPDEAPIQYNYKTIYNTVVIIVAIILGLLILLKLKKKS